MTTLTHAPLWLCVQLCMVIPKIHYTRFPVDEEVFNLLQTCCGLVSDTANKAATSRCNGIWETHDTTDTTDFCPRQLLTDLLRGNWCNGFWLLRRLTVMFIRTILYCYMRRWFKRCSKRIDSCNVYSWLEIICVHFNRPTSVSQIFWSSFGLPSFKTLV